MSDSDLPDDDQRDPVDHLYRQAEAVLSDDAVRAARRARVLAATQVGSPGAADAPPSPAYRSRMLHPAWMATAAALVLSVIVAVNIPRPIHIEPTVPNRGAAPGPLALAPSADGATAAATPSTPAGAADAVEKAGRASAPEVRATAAEPSPAPHTSSLSSGHVASVVAPPPPPPPLALPPVPAPLAEAPLLAPKAAPLQTRLAPPASATPDFAQRDRGAPQSSQAFDLRRAAPGDGLASPPAERLRAAAAAGRTSEVEALLAKGVPVDAADAEGETALLKSVRAGQLGTAALLRRQGASLDQPNKSGETARNLAAAKADPQLDKALNLPR